MSEEQRFRGAVSRSRDTVLHVAKHLQPHGTVTLPQSKMRPTFADREGYGDEFDLQFDRGSLDRDIKDIEVKERGLTFTCAGDFPYETVFVDRVTKADKANVTYVSLSHDLNYCLIVYPQSRERWTKSVRWDSVKHYQLEVYECPKVDAVFCKIEDLGTHL